MRKIEIILSIPAIIFLIILLIPFTIIHIINILILNSLTKILKKISDNISTKNIKYDTNRIRFN